jgi:hypothetical protein
MRLRDFRVENSKHTDLAFEDIKRTVNGLTYVGLALPEPLCKGAAVLMGMLNTRGWRSSMTKVPQSEHGEGGRVHVSAIPRL